MAEVGGTELDEFTITFRREVVFYLRKLINDQEPVTVMFNEGRELLLTLLLDLDEESNSLVFDLGANETTNEALLNCASAQFVANPLGVRNQFHASQIGSTDYEGRPAFVTEIPERFLRLQRREYFRLHLSLARRISCRLQLPLDARTVEMLVIDIGLGGVALDTCTQESLLEAGQCLRDVALNLGGFGILRVDMEVCHVESSGLGGRGTLRAGCRFLGLNQRQENELQRFITQIQCEERPGGKR